MYRQVFTPNERNNFVTIPREWYGHTIEVIVFPAITSELGAKRQIRQGWDIAAQEMHAKGDDKLLMEDALTDKNTDWWTWDE
ncbi:MAG: hypothetical protein LBR50_01115 [Tannerella sp.]|nr:hypothetical protein [Tannerella sp.]